MLVALNHDLFLAIDASGHPPSEVLAGAQFMAQWSVFVAMAVLVALWIWGGPGQRGPLLATVVGILVALSLNQLAGLVWYEPRPFASRLGHTWLAHVPDNSFPSDHAAFIWALGLGLMVTNASRLWGALVTLLGLAVAWARIYLGVHYPIDMVGSGVTAAVGAAVAWASVSPVSRWFLPVADFLYERGLRLLRAPSAIFPRDDRRPRDSPHSARDKRAEPRAR